MTGVIGVPEDRSHWREVFVPHIDSYWTLMTGTQQWQPPGKILGHIFNIFGTKCEGPL